MNRKKLEQVLAIVGDMHDALAYHNIGDGRAKMRTAAGLVHELLKETDPVTSQPAIAVKGLEWVERDLFAGSPPLIVWEAKTPLNVYALERIGDRPWFCHFLCAHFKTLEAAKAAAQADYETRIRSQIVASPPPSGKVEALREAANIAFDEMFKVTGAPVARAVQQKILALAALSVAPPTADGWRTKAADDVLVERKRQVEAEGWTPEHDDQHDRGEMARAAGLYALIAGADPTNLRNAEQGYGMGDVYQEVMNRLWPWSRSWFKSTTRRRNLVKAGALILAEIERIDRLPAAPTDTGGR